MSVVTLRQSPAWDALQQHYHVIKGLHLRQLFTDDAFRGQRLTVDAEGIYLDYSKNRISDETLRLLFDLARQAGLRDRIDAMFRGDKINVSENRAVLHAALRAPHGASIIFEGCNVVPEVHAVLNKMAGFAEQIRSGAWKGGTGKPIRNVVNIGIGGSDLGPVMAYEAIKHYSAQTLTFRFVSNVDSTDFFEAVRDLDPAETLFIVCSKTFTTLETLTNANARRKGKASVRKLLIRWIYDEKRQELGSSATIRDVESATTAGMSELGFTASASTIRRALK